MQDITKTFTIQWVGPFKDIQQMKNYLNDDSTCNKSLFNFYFFSGNKIREVRRTLILRFMHILEFIKRLMGLRNVLIVIIRTTRIFMKMTI